MTKPKIKVERRGTYQGVPQYGITGCTEITPTLATAKKWAALANAERTNKLDAVWRNTHRDYKGTIDGVRMVMILRDGATVLAALDNLTDAEIEVRLKGVSL